MAGMQGADALIIALAAGMPVAEAARSAGVSERTAWRRLAEPAVQRQIRDLRTAMLDRAVGKLADATAAAVDTLVDNLEAEGEGVQVRAAVAILDQAVKLRESEELARRVFELEAALGMAERKGRSGTGDAA